MSPMTRGQRLKALTLLSALGAIASLIHSMQVVDWRVSAAKDGPIQASAGRMPASSGQVRMPEAIRFRPEPGQRYTYAFERAIRVSGMGKEIPDIHYTGKFFVDVISADMAGFDAWVSEQVEHYEEASPLLFKIHVDASGKSLELSSPSFKTETDKQHAGIIKDLVACWIFPLESDTVGAYRASYEPAVVRGAFARVQKHKIAYVRISAMTPEIVSSNHTVEWDLQREMPASVRGEEVTRLGQAQSSSPSSLGNFSSEAKYSIVLIGMSARPSLGMSDDLHSESLALTPDSTAARARARFTAADWPKFEQRLRNVANLSQPEQLALFGDLAAFLRSQGAGGVSQLMGLLNGNAIAAGPSSPLFKQAVGALATAGTPEAQAALLQIYQDPNSAEAGKGTILAALTTTQASLTSQTRDFLLSESENESDPNLASGAAWAAGSAIQNAPTDSSAERAVASIQQAWQSSQTESQQLVLLDAMGNSGSVQFFPILSEVIGGSGDLPLRSKAVYALRSIQTPEASALLNQELSDPNPAIRQAAENALQR